MSDPVGGGSDEAHAPGTSNAPAGIGDLVAGSLAVVFGVGVVLYVRGFPSLPGGLPGPALFPGIIGALFAAFGAALVVQWFRRRRGFAPPQGADEAPPPPVSRRQALNASAVVAAVLAYILVVDVLGFAVTMALLLLGLMLLLGARVLVAVAASVVTTGLLVLLFQYVLLVPLPTGLFG